MGKHKKKPIATAKVQGRRRKAVDHGRSAAKGKAKPSTKSKAAKTKLSAETLVQQAVECLENFEHQLALEHCEAALLVAADNTAVLETIGELLLELGDMERAAQCFLKAVELCPQEGHKKYLCLGQLYQGLQAAGYLLKGIDIMAAFYKMHATQLGCAVASPAAVDEVTALDLSNAYCSLAEVYLTDCCFDDDAEEKCGDYCTKALEYGESNSEAYQLMGSYLLSKQEIDKSRSMLLQGLSLWLRDDESCNVQVPSYQSQVNWSKLLIEVGEHQKAQLVLEGLLQQDDEVIQVWYLLGWLAHLQDQYPTARQCLRKTKELYNTISDCDDDQLMVHTEELLEEMGDSDNSDQEIIENCSDDDDCMEQS